MAIIQVGFHSNYSEDSLKIFNHLIQIIQPLRLILSVSMEFSPPKKVKNLLCDSILWCGLKPSVVGIEYVHNVILK